jgi:2-polyprenyl-3-methyl-5-hydroxy-6-metoxy-1,4-benzoquinol methylase
MSMPAAPAPNEVPCPICAAPARFERALGDDRYAFPGVHRLHRCAACGHGFLDLTMNPAEIGHLYTEFYPRASFDAEAWSPPKPASLLRSWWFGLRASAFRWVPPGVRVLDIGCGFGESLGYHRDRGCDAHGVEADANILRVAKRHGLQVEHGLFDASRYSPASFDVVTLDQVIEHVSDPAEVFGGIAQVLKPGGLLIVTTPNAQGIGARLFGQKWIHWHAPYHQQFFSTASLRKVAAGAGLVLKQRVTITNSAWLGFQWCHLMAYPAPGQRSAFWSPKQGRTLAQRWGFRFLALLDRLGVNAALTRIADATGCGDNAVFILEKAAPR